VTNGSGTLLCINERDFIPERALRLIYSRRCQYRRSCNEKQKLTYETRSI